MRSWKFSCACMFLNSPRNSHILEAVMAPARINNLHSFVHSLRQSFNQQNIKKLKLRQRQQWQALEKMIILQVMKISWTFSTFLLCCLWAPNTFHVVASKKTFGILHTRTGIFQIFVHVFTSVNELRMLWNSQENFNNIFLLFTILLHLYFMLVRMSSKTFLRCR